MRFAGARREPFVAALRQAARLSGFQLRQQRVHSLQRRRLACRCWRRCHSASRTARSWPGRLLLPPAVLRAGGSSTGGSSCGGSSCGGSSCGGLLLSGSFSFVFFRPVLFGCGSSLAVLWFFGLFFFFGLFVLLWAVLWFFFRLFLGCSLGLSVFFFFSAGGLFFGCSCHPGASAVAAPIARAAAAPGCASSSFRRPRAVCAAARRADDRAHEHFVDGRLESGDRVAARLRRQVHRLAPRAAGVPSGRQRTRKPFRPECSSRPKSLSASPRPVRSADRSAAGRCAAEATPPPPRHRAPSSTSVAARLRFSCRRPCVRVGVNTFLRDGVFMAIPRLMSRVPTRSSL